MHANIKLGIDGALLGVSKLFNAANGPHIATLDIELALPSFTAEERPASFRAGTCWPLAGSLWTPHTLAHQDL